MMQKRAQILLLLLMCLSAGGYIKADEYVEITPGHLRMRKIILDEIERKHQAKLRGETEE